MISKAVEEPKCCVEPFSSILAQNADIDGEDTNNPMALANFNMTSYKKMSAE